MLMMILACRVLFEFEDVSISALVLSVAMYVQPVKQ
jgi:hypothetical protein